MKSQYKNYELHWVVSGHSPALDLLLPLRALPQSCDLPSSKDSDSDWVVTHGDKTWLHSDSRIGETEDYYINNFKYNLQHQFNSHLDRNDTNVLHVQVRINRSHGDYDAALPMAICTSEEFLLRIRSQASQQQQPLPPPAPHPAHPSPVSWTDMWLSASGKNSVFVSSKLPFESFV